MGSDVDMCVLHTFVALPAQMHTLLVIFVNRYSFSLIQSLCTGKVLSILMFLASQEISLSQFVKNSLQMSCVTLMMSLREHLY